MPISCSYPSRREESLLVSVLLKNTRSCGGMSRHNVSPVLARPSPTPSLLDGWLHELIQRFPHVYQYSSIGGLHKHIHELRQVVEVALLNPDLFARVGITPPMGCLLYGPTGSGKTLLARTLCSQLDKEITAIQVVASALVANKMGDSVTLLRHMFNYARDHQPCVIFMDEIDAIGGHRFSGGTSADREIQRTLTELLNQMDGFESLGRVKMIMATNRADTLDAALLRRLDTKIAIPLPDEEGRLEVLKIHAKLMSIQGEMDWKAVADGCEGMSGAQLRNVCTQAGLTATNDERDHVLKQDFLNVVRKLSTHNKKLSTKLDYKPV